MKTYIVQYRTRHGGMLFSFGPQVRAHTAGHAIMAVTRRLMNLAIMPVEVLATEE